MKRFLCLVFSLAVVLCSCNTTVVETSNDLSEGAENNVSFDFAQTDAEMFTERDKRIEYDEADCARITLDGDSIHADSDSVSISDSVITVHAEGTYLISGTLDDGMIVINVNDQEKVWLILENADINCETSAPIYVLGGDKVFITLADGSENRLSNGGVFEPIDENDIDAVIFSKQDLTLNGNGSLEIDSPVGHGIVSKDDLVITGGKYTVNASSHGIDANDSVRITNASLTVAANKDGIRAENNDDAEKGFVYISSGELTITAEGDGISASNSVRINSGDFGITSGGGYENGREHSSQNWGGPMGGGGFGGGKPGNKPDKPNRSSDDAAEYSTQAAEDESTSMKGIKSEAELVIYGGSFNINSADDALHSNTSLAVYGGDFDISTGDDALHAEDTLSISDGLIDVKTSYEALEALHINVSGGDISAVATDDGINAAGGNDASGTEGGRDGMFGGGKGGPGGMSAGNGSVTISGGSISIKASGDGIDANGTLEITGGSTTVTGPTQGDTATLDFDRTGTISGGRFIGTGASGGMVQTFSESEQGVLAINVGQQRAGTKITVSDADGNLLIEHYPEMDFGLLIYSDADIVKGESYTVSVGSESKTFKAA